MTPQNTPAPLADATADPAAPPAPARSPMTDPCKTCGSTDRSWASLLGVTPGTSLLTGQPLLTDGRAMYVLGCDTCSETLHLLDGDDPTILTALTQATLGTPSATVTLTGESDPARRKRVREHGEYLAKVMAQGRMVGADWETIGRRIVDTDLLGMGYAHATAHAEHAATMRAVTAVGEDLATRGGFLEAKHPDDHSLSNNARRAAGRGDGYREAARLIAVAIGTDDDRG